MLKQTDHRALVLIDDLFYQYGLDGKEHDGVLFLPMLKGNLPKGKKLLRGIRKAYLSSFLPYKQIWLGNWSDKIDDYDTVVLGDAGNTSNVVNYIHKKYPKKRLIVWFRNSVSKTVSVNSFNRDYCELWSFDKEDCRQYNMRFNSQFYIKSPLYTEKEKTIDAFFVGQDKGRKNLLYEMKSSLEKEGLKCEFDIVGVNSKPLSYAEVLDKISHSRAIVDCQGQWQSGITLRPMEALFYNKKLITNSKDIKKYNFYNSNNVYLIGENRAIENFMNLPVEKVPDEIKMRYSYAGWIQRFNC